MCMAEEAEAKEEGDGRPTVGYTQEEKRGGVTRAEP